MASSPFYASINNGFFNRWKFVDDGDDGHCTPWESSERRGRLKMVGFGCYIQEDYAASGHYHFEPMQGSVRVKWSNAVLQLCGPSGRSIA